GALRGQTAVDPGPRRPGVLALEHTAPGRCIDSARIRRVHCNAVNHRGVHSIVNCAPTGPIAASLKDAACIGPHKHGRARGANCNCTDIRFIERGAYLFPGPSLIQEPGPSVSHDLDPSVTLALKKSHRSGCIDNLGIGWIY